MQWDDRVAETLSPSYLSGSLIWCSWMPWACMECLVLCSLLNFKKIKSWPFFFINNIISDFLLSGIIEHSKHVKECDYRGYSDIKKNVFVCFHMFFFFFYWMFILLRKTFEINLKCCRKLCWFVIYFNWLVEFIV